MLMSNKYLRGDQNVQIPAHLNFGQHMIHCIRKVDKDAKALINADNGEETTYGEFLQTVADISVSLAKLGVGKGHTVAICSERSNTIISTTLAVICTGASYTPLEVNCGRAILIHKFEITKPTYVIYSKTFWDLYKETLESFNHVKQFISIDDAEKPICSFKDILKRVDADLFEAAPVNGATDVAMVLYSSGTTGPPKGVMLTHLNLLLSCHPTNYCDNSIKILWNSGEWVHNYDTMTTFVSLSTGKTMVSHSQTKGDETVLKAIEKYKVQMLLTVPITIMRLAKSAALDDYNLSSLKIIYSRSTFLHAKTMKELKTRLPQLNHILQGYGMTEAGEPTSESRGVKGPKIGSVGTPSPCTTIKIVDINTSEPLKSNETGEIRVKGPVLMKGYIGIPPKDYLDEEGFLRTGDLGYYDEDHYIYIVDRMKEVIKFRGYQVSPSELEAVLLQHRAVREAGVVGKPEEEYGEVPMAFVVKQPDIDVTEQELIDYVAAEVSPYMQLRGGLKFITTLPRNQRGKLLRRELKEMLNSVTDIK